MASEDTMAATNLLLPLALAVLQVNSSDEDDIRVGKNPGCVPNSLPASLSHKISFSGVYSSVVPCSNT